MKKSFKKLFNFVIYFSFIISIIGHIIINRNNILNNNTKILKEMSESTQITDLNKTIEQLNLSHTEYTNQIQTSKQKIANSINMYPNNNATENNSLDELSTMITNLTNVPENTYYYESGTEGDASTIVRYKKIDEKYYICDSNGIVAEGTAATDVSSLNLIPYSATEAKYLSAGSAGYTSGKFYLGDGSDNAAHYDSVLNALVGEQSENIPSGVKTAFLMIGYITSYNGYKVTITGDNYISHEEIAKAIVPTNGQTAGGGVLFRIDLTGEAGKININAAQNGTQGSFRIVYSLIY